MNKDSSISELFAYFLSVKKSEGLAPISISDYYRYFHSYILTDCGDMTLSSFTAVYIQRYLLSYASKPCLCRHIKSTLSAMLTFAYKQDIIDTNPITKVTPPKCTHKEISYMSAEECKNFLSRLKSYNHKYFCLAKLLIVCGLRPSEAILLNDNDIVVDSFKNYAVRINKSLTSFKSAETNLLVEEVKKTKSKAGNRLVPITLTNLIEIVAYKKQYASHSDLLICNADGSLIHQQNFAQGLERFFNLNKDLKRITPYGLRHTFGNLNKANGIDSYTVSRLMGHSDPSVTLKNYYHDDTVLNTTAISKLSASLSDITNSNNSTVKVKSKIARAKSISIK